MVHLWLGLSSFPFHHTLSCFTGTLTPVVASDVSAKIKQLLLPCFFRWDKIYLWLKWSALNGLQGSDVVCLSYCLWCLNLPTPKLPSLSPPSSRFMVLPPAPELAYLSEVCWLVYILVHNSSSAWVQSPCYWLGSTISTHTSCLYDSSVSRLLMLSPSSQCNSTFFMPHWLLDRN